MTLRRIHSESLDLDCRKTAWHVLAPNLIEYFTDTLQSSASGKNKKPHLSGDRSTVDYRSDVRSEDDTRHLYGA